MDHEISKGILRVLFDELLKELSPESLERIAKGVSEKVQEAEALSTSRVQKLLAIQELEREAEIAQRRGLHVRAFLLQNKAESIRFSL
jgi:hypothetical protein